MARPHLDPTSSADGRADVVRPFPTTFRGFDQAAVRHHLEQLATALSDRDRRIHALQAELAEARAAGRRPVALDEVTLMATLGEEAARLLTTAKDGAAQMKARAEERTDTLLREAQAEAARIREEVDLDAARRRQEATAAAEAEVEQARQQGRAMVAEAQAVRERILNDLANRRKKRLSQLELLRQGRDRLLEAYDHVEQTLVDNRAVLRASDEDFRDAPSDPPTGEVEVITTSTPAPVSTSPIVASPQPSVPHQTAPVVEQPAVVEPVEPTNAVEADAEGPELDALAEADLPGEPEVVESPVVESPVVESPVVESPVVESLADAEPVAGVEHGGADERSTVDDLFARIRAARVDAVARAHEVLDRADAGPDGVEAGIVVGEGPVGVGVDVDADADVDADVDVDVDVEAAADEAAGADDEDDAADLHDIARSLAKRLKRALADEQNELLDRLRRATKTSGPVLADSTPHAERYRAAAEDDLWTAAVAGAEASGLEPLAAAASLDAGDVLDRLLDQLGERLSEPLRLRLDDAISGAPDDAEEMANAVRSVYREWKQQRIDPVAEALVQAAYQQGSDAGRVSLPG